MFKKTKEQSFLCILGIWLSRHFLQVILMAADAKENFKEGVNIGGDAISPIFPAVLFKDEDTGVKFPH